MAIKFNPNTKVVRETTAPFEYTDEATGELRVTDIRVQYYSATTKQMREAVEYWEKFEKENPDARIWKTEQLIQRLAGLPDLVDDDGKPYEITLDFLDSLVVKNLAAIAKAIEEDESPKPTQS